MKYFQSSEVADILNISMASLRSYAQLLEHAGYEFKKNTNKQRQYSEYDVNIFSAILALKGENQELKALLRAQNEAIKDLENKQDKALRAIEHPRESAALKGMQEQIDTMLRHQTKLAETAPNTNALMTEIQGLYQNMCLTK